MGHHHPYLQHHLPRVRNDDLGLLQRRRLLLRRSNALVSSVDPRLHRYRLDLVHLARLQNLRGLERAWRRASHRGTVPSALSLLQVHNRDDHFSSLHLLPFNDRFVDKDMHAVMQNYRQQSDTN